jgi:hypothetical protein
MLERKYPPRSYCVQTSTKFCHSTWVGIHMGGEVYTSFPDFSMVEIITKKGKRRNRRMMMVSGTT